MGHRAHNFTTKDHFPSFVRTPRLKFQQTAQGYYYFDYGTATDRRTLGTESEAFEGHLIAPYRLLSSRHCSGISLIDLSLQFADPVLQSLDLCVLFHNIGLETNGSEPCRDSFVEG